MFRKTLFWAHLVAGVISGLVVFIMSITGVLLTFERQILAWSAQSHYVSEENQTEPLPLEQLLFISKNSTPEFSASSIAINNDKGAPVILRAGRSGAQELNPYTGEEMSTASPELEDFFRAVTGFHRWFNIEGENRSVARAITGASNLMFLFLIVSGLYLWLPSLYKWGIFKTRLFFNTAPANSKTRDFNWHHVFGIWSAIPLAIVVATATVFSYGWANNLVYQVFGEEVPVRGRAAPGGNSDTSNAGSLPVSRNLEYLTSDELFSHAQSFVESNLGNWREITLTIPKSNDETASFAIDLGNGGQPHLRHNLSLARDTGEVAQWEPFSSQSPGRQTRSIVRFLHTGEVLGIWGQFIAGLVSFTSLFMVWTGLALSYRRLIQPLLTKRK